MCSFPVLFQEIYLINLIRCYQRYIKRYMHRDYYNMTETNLGQHIGKGLKSPLFSKTVDKASKLTRNSRPLP